MYVGEVFNLHYYTIISEHDLTDEFKTNACWILELSVSEAEADLLYVERNWEASVNTFYSKLWNGLPAALQHSVQSKWDSMWELILPGEQGSGAQSCHMVFLAEMK